MDKESLSKSAVLKRKSIHSSRKQVLQPNKTTFLFIVCYLFLFLFFFLFLYMIFTYLQVLKLTLIDIVMLIVTLLLQLKKGKTNEKDKLIQMIIIIVISIPMTSKYGVGILWAIVVIYERTQIFSYERQLPRNDVSIKILVGSNYKM